MKSSNFVFHKISKLLNRLKKDFFLLLLDEFKTDHRLKKMINNKPGNKPPKNIFFTDTPAVTP